MLVIEVLVFGGGKSLTPAKYSEPRYKTFAARRETASILRNPPKGGRREVAPSAGSMIFGRGGAGVVGRDLCAVREGFGISAVCGGLEAKL